MSSTDASPPNDPPPTDDASLTTNLEWGRILKRGLVLFWALWLSIVLLTNVLDGVKTTGLLGPDWTLASGNYALMQEVTAVHGTPPVLVGGLFVGAVLWECVGAILLWRAFLVFNGANVGRREVYQAFTVVLALFATFMLMTEVFLAYELEATHMRIFIAQLVSVLSIAQLPD